MRTIAEFTKTTLIGGVLVLIPIYLSVLLLLKALGGIVGWLRRSPRIAGGASVARSDRNTDPHRGMLRLRSRGADRTGTAGQECNRAHGPRTDSGLRAHPRSSRAKSPGRKTSRPSPSCWPRSRTRWCRLPRRGVRRRSLRHLRSSVPTPAAGAIYIIAKSRVHVVDVPFTSAVSVISKWGAGSSELLAGMKRAQATLEAETTAAS
jgi:hypothetical protein